MYRLRTWPIMLCLAAVAAKAQPVITAADAPQDGQQYTYLPGTYDPLTASGPNATWDLSAVAAAGEGQIVSFIDAAAAGHAGLFPSSNIVLLDGTGESYLRKDASGLYRAGYFQQLNGLQLQITYSDEELMLPYPCAYNTAYTDSFTYTYPYLQNVVHGGGRRTYTADAFGSVVLPYGQVDNVLLLRGVTATSETLAPDDYLTVENTVFLYRPGLSYFLLMARNIVRYHNGEQTGTGMGMTYLSEQAFAGIAGPEAQAIGVEAWPVPARNQMNVRYGLAGGRRVELQLVDATGRTVRTQLEQTGATGLQQAMLNVQGLPAGIYLLTVSDGQGQRGTCRVAVE